jgi:hypothetical protein
MENSKKQKFLPLFWYLILTLSITTGILLLNFKPQGPQWISYVDESLNSDNFFNVVGIIFISVPLTHVIIFLLLMFIRDNLFKINADYILRNLWPPVLLGFFESIMYPLALLIDQPNFIGVWLLFKVASQWSRWGQDHGNSKKKEKKTDENRRRYIHFLIGNALSLIFGVATYGVLKIVIH